MAMILVNVLHASPEPAFAMFSEVMDSGNKRAMILAAARASLAAEDFEWLEAIASVYRMQMDIRNKFVHWLWGACEQVEDGLLLVDPRYMLGHARQHQQEWKRTEMENSRSGEQHDRLMAAMRFDFDKIYVYRKNDFDLVLRDVSETLQMIGEFAYIINPLTETLDNSLNRSFPGRQSLIEKARQRLPNLRLFSEALHRRQNKRQKS